MEARTFVYDVFLSYSSKDKATVHPLAERLRDDGLHVWLDEWEIRPNDRIPVKIEEGLEKKFCTSVMSLILPRLVTRPTVLVLPCDLVCSSTSKITARRLALLLDCFINSRKPRISTYDTIAFR